MSNQSTYHPRRLTHFIYTGVLCLLLFLFVARPVVERVIVEHKLKSELFETEQEEDPVQEENEDRLDSLEALKYLYHFECRILNTAHKRAGIHYAFAAFKETFKTVRLPPPKPHLLQSV